MDSNRLSVQHNNNGGVESKPPVHHRHHHGGSRRGGGRPQQGAGGKGIKVVYISSPVMLTASAEEFRAVVQELTGRDSNVADLAHAVGAPPFSSSSSSSYSSSFGFGRASGPTMTTATTDACALPQTRAMATATATASPGRPAEYAAGLAAPPPFQFQGTYDQTGSLLYGRQDYW